MRRYNAITRPVLSITYLILSLLAVGIRGYRKDAIAFCPVAHSTSRWQLPIHELQSSSCQYRIRSPLYASEPEESSNKNEPDLSTETNRRMQIRKRISTLARNLVIKPLSYAAPMPQAIGAVLKDATLGAIDLAVDEVMNRKNGNEKKSTDTQLEQYEEVDVVVLVDEAFAPLEQTLVELEDALQKARLSLKDAKTQATFAMGAIQAAAIAQAEGAVTAVAAAEERVIADIYADTNNVDVSTLGFEDVDYDSSEMAPPFINDDQCLVPGEPVIRVEKAPENSRRIFAGIDIMASVDDVWKVLTDYNNLQKVVPNLVVNEVLELYDGIGKCEVDATLPEESQCEEISKCMKGSLLKQVGGAKVAGINFSARTKLEVREWPQGMPDFAHFNDDVYEGKTRTERAKDYGRVKLQRYKFPRPFAISRLPTKDISMQSVKDDDGEFRMYQGVWRMQPLPGCAPKGDQAMRLTYAVEVSPRAYLPVRLVEGRIAADLCTNLKAIRDFVEKQ